jgi:4-amino-4-deoxy-L-arabinose transferase-like glycosyltransferase
VGQPRWIFWCFLLYFALHVGVRLLLPESLELDEAEQVVLAQDFRWSYGVRHPPLYTWVQHAAFSVCGTGALGLALVKNLFLFLTFWFVYRAGCEATGRWSLGLLAALSTLFIPQFMWEAYRDLTHSVAASAFAAATIWLVLRLRRQPTAAGYCWLGIVAVLGALSKLNYLILLSGVAIACFSVRSFRPVVTDRRGLITVGWLVLLIIYPLALASRPGTPTVETMNVGHASRLQSAASLLWAAPAFVLPGLAIYLLFTWPDFKWKRFVSDEDHWLGWVMAIGVLGCLGSALVNGMYFKDRHLMPILIALPVWLVCRAAPALTAPRIRRLEILALSVASGVLMGLPASTWIMSKIDDPNRRSARFDVLASALRAQSGEPAVIIAENRWLGANLLLEFPRSVVEVPEASLGLAQPRGNWIVVWDDDKRPRAGSTQVAERARAQTLAERLSGRTWQWEPHATVSAPYLYSQTKALRLGVANWKGTGPGS